MQNKMSLCPPDLRQILSLFVFTTLLILTFSLPVKAQPQASFGDSRSSNDRKYNPYSPEYQSPREEIMMSESSTRRASLTADGEIDPTFNAEFTEGFGYVNKTVIQPDGKIIAVGLFHRANGVAANGIARFHADGTLDTSFNSGAGANGAIRAVDLQSDGKIIIGGAFTGYDGQTVPRIARLNSNGSFDSSFTPVNFGSQINDILVIANDKIMVGGQFVQSSSRLVRLNSNGTLDSVITGFNNTVYSLTTTPDSKIVVGGQFSQPRAKVARLNLDGTLDADFNPGANGSSTEPVLEVVVQPDKKIIVGGYFYNFAGTLTDSLVRLNENGTVDTGFNLINDNNTSALVMKALALQPDGKFLVSYQNQLESDASVTRRFNADGSPDASFNVNTDDLSALDLKILSDGKVLAGGEFTTINNQKRLRLVKLNSNGTFDNIFQPEVSTAGYVFAIKREPDGKIIVGGDFDYINGIRKNTVARLNPDGSLDNTFAISSTLFGSVYALELQPDGKIIIGGTFYNEENINFSSYARLNSDGSLDTLFNDGNYDVFGVYALALQPDGKILAGGSIYDQNAAAAIRLHPDGTLDTGFSPAATSFGTPTYALFVQPTGKILAGINSNFQNLNSIYPLNINGTLASGFAGTGNVLSFEAQRDGKILAGGTNLRRFSTDGVLDSTLNTGSGFNNTIRDIECLPDGKILVGGFFTTYNGNQTGQMIRINSDGALDSAYSFGQHGRVYAIDLQPDGKILVGGQFISFNGTTKLSLVRLNNSVVVNRATPYDFDGDDKTDLSVFRPTDGTWWYQRSSDAVVRAAQFGASTDKAVPADYTGDGKTDVAFWRPASGEWFILRSEDSSFLSFPFGASNDVPVSGDFDGDGKADPTVYRPATNEWYILKSTGGTSIITFGTAGDLPVAADYDGDGKSDIAIFRPSDGSWWYLQSSNSQFRVYRFGVSTDRPVPGDYTGDGKADIAVFRPSTGEWFFQRSEDNSFYSLPFGAAGDVPTPGDYDGDGRFDTAVFRAEGATWYVQRSTAGLHIQQFGLSTDLPVPSSFVP